MAFRKFGVTALGTLVGGTFATYALRQNDDMVARVQLEEKVIKRARKLPPRSEQISALQSGEEYDVLIIGGEEHDLESDLFKKLNCQLELRWSNWRWCRIGFMHSWIENSFS